jgi:1,4-dihydroxy-2-naphthoyl-CoA hydrolase
MLLATLRRPAGRLRPVAADESEPGGVLPPHVRGLGEGTVGEVLDIETVEATPERVVLRLPVTWKTHQPYGVLHGGVSALLAETAASFGGAVSVPPGQSVVGIELNASHLRPMTAGTLTAVATPIRKGRTVQVSDVALTDDDDRAICRARCTLAVVTEVAAPGAAGAG